MSMAPSGFCPTTMGSLRFAFSGLKWPYLDYLAIYVDIIYIYNVYIYICID